LSAAAKLPLLRSKPLYQNNFFSEKVVASGHAPHILTRFLNPSIPRSVLPDLLYFKIASIFVWSMALIP
jgi:hypothetical protein